MGVTCCAVSQARALHRQVSAEYTRRSALGLIGRAASFRKERCCLSPPTIHTLSPGSVLKLWIPAARCLTAGRPCSTSSQIEPETLNQAAPPHLDSQIEPSRRKTGAFQKLPTVQPGQELLNSALKRARRISGDKAIKNKAQHARNLAARRLDGLTKELTVPLGKYLRECPTLLQLHPFEKALLELTLGGGRYEQCLKALDKLRKSSLEIGKGYAGRAAKATSMKDAFGILEEGFETLEQLFSKNLRTIDATKDALRDLRKLPTVNSVAPTVALVGVPNVGKSSLVQLLSSGVPEICDYPFTTRTVQLGHFSADGIRYQVTDTPGLLDRKEEDRNAMELLTLASLRYLPTLILFVTDLTEHCGTHLASQWRIREGLRSEFGGRIWIDIFSKADLLTEKLHSTRQSPEGEAQLQIKEDGKDAHLATDDLSAEELIARMPEALSISSMNLSGIEALKTLLLSKLAGYAIH